MGFLARDVTRITGVKRNRLQQWIDFGFVAPSEEEASGHGTRNIWSRVDLYTIAIFKKLTESGLSRKVVADFLSKGVLPSDLSDSKLNNITFILYVRKGGKTQGAAIIESTELDLVEISKDLEMKGFEDAYVLNFAKIKREIDSKIEEG